jgi:hypothetical protein
MNLTEWNSRLQQHFEELRRQRLAAAGDKPIFVLEHGLGARELQDLTTEIRSHIVASAPDDGHWLPWIVYAAELGYLLVDNKRGRDTEAATMNMQLERLRWGSAANRSLIAGSSDDLRGWRQP